MKDIMMEEILRGGITTDNGSMLMEKHLRSLWFNTILRRSLFSPMHVR